MQVEALLHIAQIDEAIDLAERVAGHVAERRRHRRTLAEPVQGDDGKQLVEGPRIGHGLEDAHGGVARARH